MHQINDKLLVAILEKNITRNRTIIDHKRILEIIKIIRIIGNHFPTEDFTM